MRTLVNHHFHIEMGRNKGQIIQEIHLEEFSMIQSGRFIIHSAGEGEN